MHIDQTHLKIEIQEQWQLISFQPRQVLDFAQVKSFVLRTLTKLSPSKMISYQHQLHACQIEIDVLSIETWLKQRAQGTSIEIQSFVLKKQQFFLKAKLLGKKSAFREHLQNVHQDIPFLLEGELLISPREFRFEFYRGVVLGIQQFVLDDLQKKSPTLNLSFLVSHLFKQLNLPVSQQNPAVVQLDLMTELCLLFCLPVGFKLPRRDLISLVQYSADGLLIDISEEHQISQFKPQLSTLHKQYLEGLRFFYEIENLMVQGQLKEAFHEYSMANHPFAHQRVIELAVNLKSELPRLAQYLRQLSSTIDPHLLCQGQYLSWQLKFDGEVYFQDDKPQRTPQLLALIDWMKVCMGSIEVPFQDDYFNRACFEMLLLTWFDLLDHELEIHENKELLILQLDHFYDQGLLSLLVSTEIFEKLFQYEIKCNRLEKAVFVLDHQIEMAKLSGNFVQASLGYIKIGELYHPMDIEKANAYYDLSLRLNPNQFLAYQAKAVLLEERGEKEAAILSYQNALKGMQDLPHNQSFKAEIEKKIKDLERKIFIEREFASLERFESEQLAKAVSFEEVSQHLKQTLFHDQEQINREQATALKEAKQKEILEKEEKKRIIQAKLKALQEQWHDEPKEEEQTQSKENQLNHKQTTIDEFDLHEALSQSLQNDDSIEGLDHFEFNFSTDQPINASAKNQEQALQPSVSEQLQNHVKMLEQKAEQAVNRIQKYKALFELAEYLRDEVMDFERSQTIFLEIVSNAPINQYEMLEASIDDLIETFTSQEDYEALRDLYDLLIKRNFDNVPFLYLQKAVYHYQLGEYHSALIAIENSKLKLKDYQKQKSEYLKQKLKLEGMLDLEIKILKQLGREDELIDLLTDTDDLSEEEIQYRQLLLARYLTYKEPMQALQIYAEIYPQIEEASLKDVVFQEWFDLSELIGDPVEKSKLLDQQAQKIQKEIQYMQRELEGLEGKPAQKIKLDLQKLIRKQSKLYSHLAMDLEDHLPMLAIDLYLKAYQIWSEDFDSAEKVCSLARQEKKYQILMDTLQSLISVALEGEGKGIYLITLAGVYLILGNFEESQTHLQEALGQLTEPLEDRSRLIDVLDWIRSTVSENNGPMDKVNRLLKDLELRLNRA